VSYALERHEQPGVGLARVIAEQADRLRRDAPGAKIDSVVFVHKARVRCKKIRAALRLAAPLMGEKAYKRENAWWRNAARGLSDLRDMSARIEALQALATYLRAHISVAQVAALRTRIEAQREAYIERRVKDFGDEHPVEAFIAAVAERASHRLEIEPGEPGDIVASLGEGYHAARKAMKMAFADGSSMAFHDWRKQVKSHALQVRLMQRLPGMAFGERYDDARDLAELLGGMQDIEVLMLTLRGKEEAAIGEVLGTRMSELMGQAGSAGAPLFGLKRKAWLAEIAPGASAFGREEAGADN